MSGLEVIGVVLGLWPIIATLTRQYKDFKGANPDELKRDVQITSYIYGNLIKDILLSALPRDQVQGLMASNDPHNKALWERSDIQQKLRNRLDDRFDLTIQCVNDMRVLLGQVKAELERLCRDNEGLGRAVAKVKTMRAGSESSPIREKLKKVKKLNKELKMLLNDQPSLIPFQQHQSQQTTIAISAFKTNGTKAGQFFEAIKNKYTCACQRPHVIGVGCYCATCADPFNDNLTIHSEWDFRLACRVSQNGQEPPTKAPTTVLLESVSQTDPDAATLNDLCSLVEEVALEETVRNVLIDAENSRMYMKATKIGANGNTEASTRNLADIRQQGNGLRAKDRREMALRLCLAILQLCDTPWMSEAWTWNICVSQVAGEGHEGSSNDKMVRYPVIFREMYSMAYKADSASIQTAVAPSLFADWCPDEEPVLTKLGLALIELALGKSIEDMKKTEHWPEDTQHYSEILGDQADRVMAKRLLQTDRIRNKATMAYENAVRVCINREFVDKDGNPSRLVSKHSTFLERFRDTVLLPLLEVWKRYEM
ncbi:hypothetical protein QBC41DRAFT_26787 [Cercophora samala]|uniref:DUF7580 domain-containing protein n=1 Tax=Cercophora samala TaxID=330535 RepID=A0AA39Z2N5_9PEZI|nr:hypothetical protein QBC41DRAFT_26787 [Cercophora samala]